MAAPQEQTAKRNRPVELVIPPNGISGLTGVMGTLNWGSLNKFSQGSRWGIGDVDSDDEYNWLPMGGTKLMIPGNSTAIDTLPSPVIWQTSIYFNGAIYLFSLCANGTLYQDSALGIRVSVGTGFTTAGVVDIACYQSTLILLSDSAAQKIYSWNGTALTTVFSTQPVQYIGVFAGRLWMANGSVIQWTAAGTYNSLAGDSGSYIVTDAFCSNPINGMYDFPAGLYVSGSNWWKTITNLQDTGSPAVLIFNQATLEGQIGPLSKWSVTLVGSVVYFGNTAGYWNLNGSTPTQVSGPWLNGFFANFNWANTSLASAYGVINGAPCVFFQAYYNGDAQVGAGYRVFGFTLTNQQWFSYAGGTIKWITGIASIGSANNNPVVWGCDGTSIFTLFTNTVSSVSAQYNGKLWSMGSMLGIDHILSVAVVLVITGATTCTINQMDETNTVRKSTTQSQNPSLGQLQNNMGALGDGKNNGGTLGLFEGVVTQQYWLVQVDGYGRGRCTGLNLNVQGIAVNLVGIIISYHHTQAGIGS